MAHEHIQYLFRRSIYNNLFDGHPPFQIDGNFGYTAGVAEMLLQSHEENTIRMLPALPEAWASGYVKGLKARGGLVIDIVWKDGRATDAKLIATKAGEITIIVNDDVVPVNYKKGENRLRFL